MRCRACRRTITPSQAKLFSGFDFCTECYTALNLKSLEPKELDNFFLSLSSEDTLEMFKNMVALASQFDSKGCETILKRCIQSFDDEPPTPSEILGFLLPAKALEDSTGSVLLSTTGELALIHMSKKLASDLMGLDLRQLGEIDDDTLKMVCNLIKRHCSICIDVLDQLNPSVYTEMIRDRIHECEDMFESMVAPQEVDVTSMKKNISIECTEELCSELKEKIGAEKVFHGWAELKNALVKLNEIFEESGIKLVIPELASESGRESMSGPATESASDTEQDYPLLSSDADIYLITGTDEIFMTYSWEKLKKSISNNDFDAFTEIMSEGGAPLFVLEKAAKDMNGLETFLENLLVNSPDNVYAVILYTELLLHQEKLEKAVTFLEKKCSEIPDEPMLLREIGTLLGGTGETEKALQYLEKAAELKPENRDIPFFMGKICENSGEFTKAFQYYKKAQDMGPPHAAAMNAVERMHIAAALSHVEELLSEEEYKKALNSVDEYFDPAEISIFHYYKGVILSRMDQSKKALELLTDYLDVYPEDEEGWLEKAGVYLDLGRFADAARSFRKCSRLNPQDIRPLVWEAVCHKQLGRSRYYKRCINKAKRIDREATKALLKQLPFN
jgi:tetratricopeptide (TPR) repeat protein